MRFPKAVATGAVLSSVILACGVAFAARPPVEGGFKQDGFKKDAGFRQDGFKKEGGFKPETFKKEDQGGRFVFMVQGIRADADAQRLRQLLQSIQGVREVSFKPADMPGTALVYVSTSGPVPQEAIVRTLAGAGFPTQLVEVSKEKPGGFEGKEGRPDGARLLFLAGPVRSDQEAARLREALQKVEGVLEISMEPNRERPQTALVLVNSKSKTTMEGIVRTARTLGVEMRLMEERRVDGKGGIDKGKIDGKIGKDGFPGGVPRGDKGVVLPGGGPRLDKETLRGSIERKLGDAGKRADENRFGKPEDGPVQATFLAGPIRTDQEAARLREALQRVDGVREVGLQPAPGQPGVAQVVITSKGRVPGDALAKAARSLGIEMRLQQQQGPKPADGPPKDE